MKRENIFLKIWRVIYPVGIYFLISNIISFAFIMVYAIALQGKAMASGEALEMATFQADLTSILYKNSMMLTAIAATIMIPIAYLLFKNDKKRENIQYEKGQPGLYGFIIIVAGFACLGGNQLLTLSRLDEIFPGFEKISEALYGGNIVMEVLAAVILAPIVEELLFRGLVFKRLHNYVGKIPAMILSSLFFGIYHGNIVQGVYAFVIGMLFVFIYDRYKTLIAPILAHIFANLISVLSVETGLFNVLYKNKLNFYLSTVIEVVICIMLIVAISKKVIRNEIIKEEIKQEEIRQEVYDYEFVQKNERED